MISLYPTETDVNKLLRSFLVLILADRVLADDVILSQVNRVPEPKSKNFVLFTPISSPRISTNLEEAVDTYFTAVMAGTLMTVTALEYGAIEVGTIIFGPDVAAGTKVAALGTGTGGVGTYTLSLANTIASQNFATGKYDVEQDAEAIYQLDVHGPMSADNAKVISTLVRSTYATQFFSEGLGGRVSPLYADDPRQMPFTNDQNQYETRWVIECHLEADQTVSVPQQFFDAASVEVIDVDATYPPS